MTLYITSGPSGSGKTTYYNNHYKNTKLICPDDIREEVNGDINSQDNASKVWNTAYKRMTKALKQRLDVYFCATFCTKKEIKLCLDQVEQIKLETKINIVILRFKDGNNLSLLTKRVEEDLGNKVNRSNTLSLNTKGETIIEHQYKNFIKMDWKKVLELQKYYKNITINIRDI